MKTSILKTLISNIDKSTDPKDIINMLDCAFHYESKPDWLKYYTRFIHWLDSGMPNNALPHSVYSESGNEKLPFLAFGVLPAVTCPGASKNGCLKYCYSYKAFRYPGAFFRMLQNTLLIWHNKKLIYNEMKRVLNKPKFQKMDKVVFRLYVDGDVDSKETMEFWFNVMWLIPKLSAYGYTKSLELLIDASNSDLSFPDNYTLNISSGSRYSSDIEAIAQASTLVRGRFISVPLNKRFTNKQRLGKEYKQTVRQAFKKLYGGKCFVCPNKCNKCSASNGHACGSSAFNRIPIAIGIS